MATKNVARSSFETSLLQSLSTIQKNSSRSRSRSRPRRHSNDNVPSRQSSPKIRHPQGQRRATVRGPAPTFDNLNEQHMPLIPTTGILKSHNDTDIISTPSQSNRVSFSRRRDGSMRNHITSFDADASPKESVETKRPSLRDSMNWPPPPPPRPDTSCTKIPSENKAASLPFRTGPVRRYSMLEMEERRKDEIEEQESSAAVDMIPRLPFSRRRTDGDYDIPSQPTEIQLYSGARYDYSLGDKAKCTSHMIIQDDPQEAFNQVSRLKQHDFAFVKRTDGLWTYAILAHRYIDEGEECMMFVMHQVGSTKTIKKNQWAGFVRLVADKTVMEEEQLDSTLPRSIFVDSRARDDCSLISFFSNN